MNKGLSVKIGVSLNLKLRVQVLSCLEKGACLIWATPLLTNAVIIERIAHTLLIEHRTTGEWFSVPCFKAIETICQAIALAKLGDFSQAKRLPDSRSAVAVYATTKVSSAAQPNHADCDIIDEQQILQLLAQECARSNKAAWAKEHDISPPYVSDVLLGRRTPGAKILDALGLVRVTSFEGKNADAK